MVYMPRAGDRNAGARATFTIKVMSAVKLTACLLTSFDQYRPNYAL